MMLLLWGNLHAQEYETNRSFLADHLRFYYLPSPNDIGSGYLLDNAKIAKSDICPDCDDFWTSSHTQNAKNLVRALLRSSENGGDMKLQQYARKILEASTEPAPVQIWIYDDAEEPLTELAYELYDPCVDDKGYVWPCAAGNEPAAWEKYSGFMHLGTFHLQEIGIEKSKSLFLHQLAHSQDHIASQAHISHLEEPELWLQDEAGKEYKYPSLEVAPSWPLAYREGLANTFDFLYNPEQARRIFNWYDKNNILLVDAVYNKKNAEMPEDEWLYHRICKAFTYQGEKPSSVEYGPTIVKYYREYYIQYLPAAFIIRNEMIMALMFSGYIKYVGLDKFETSWIETNFRIENGEKSDPFTELFYQLLVSTPDNGKNIFDLSLSSTQGPKSHLLLMAYVDYFTRYSIQTKAEFAKLFGIAYKKDPTEDTKANVFNTIIDLYWLQARDDIQYIMNLEETNFEDLESIALTLDIPISN